MHGKDKKMTKLGWTRFACSSSLPGKLSRGWVSNCYCLWCHLENITHSLSLDRSYKMKQHWPPVDVNNTIIHVLTLKDFAVCGQPSPAGETSLQNIIPNLFLECAVNYGHLNNLQNPAGNFRDSKMIFTIYSSFKLKYVDGFCLSLILVSKLIIDKIYENIRKRGWF